MVCRKNFIEYVHKSIYNESMDNQILKYDPIIFVEISDNFDDDMFQNSNNLLEKINSNIPIQLRNKLSLLDVLNIFEFSLKDNYQKNKNILYVSYNKLFDLIVDKNLINNKTVKIYRIEGDSGLGIYQDLIKKNNSISSTFDISEETPSPMSDGELKSIFGTSRIYVSEEYSQEWFFGFEDKKDIYKWFNSQEGLLEYIIKNGNAKIVEYEVSNNDIISTKTQSAFKKVNSKKITEEFLVSIIKNENSVKDFIAKKNSKKKLKSENQLNFDF